jgi:hypothetical protein
MQGNHNPRRPRFVPSQRALNVALTRAEQRASILAPIGSELGIPVDPNLPLQSYSGTSKAALETMLALKQNEKLQRLGTPIKIKEADWLAYGAGRREIPADVRDEVDVRWMILAEHFGVDPFDPDWWAITSRRVTERLLTGGGGPKRRFPMWVLSAVRTSSSRTFPDSGSLFVVRPGGTRSKFSNGLLDQAKVLLRNKPAHVTRVKAVLPLVESRARTVEESKAEAKSLLNAVRYQYRSRQKGKR